MPMASPLGPQPVSSPSLGPAVGPPMLPAQILSQPSNYAASLAWADMRDTPTGDFTPYNFGCPVYRREVFSQNPFAPQMQPFSPPMRARAGSRHSISEMGPIIENQVTVQPATTTTTTTQFQQPAAGGIPGAVTYNYAPQSQATYMTAGGMYMQPMAQPMQTTYTTHVIRAPQPGEYYDQMQAMSCTSSEPSTPPYGGRGPWDKGGGKGKARPPKRKGSPKHTCKFIVPVFIAEDSKFRVTKLLIGRGGANMRQIAEETGAKLRVRGKGSGHLEGVAMKESTDPLMLCISCPEKEGYDQAKNAVTSLFHNMFEQYAAHCRKSGREPPELRLEVLE